MNLLFISNLYPPNVVGGYEVLCHEVATGLAECGHEVTVLTSCYGGRPARAANQTVHQALRLAVGATIYNAYEGSIVQRQILDRDNANMLRRTIEESRPDVIFVWNLYGLGRAFFDALIRSEVKLSVMLTDNWLIEIFNPAFISSYFQHNVFGPPGKELSLKKSAAKLQPVHVQASAIFGSAYMRDLHAAAGLAFERESIIHNGVQSLIGAEAKLRDRSQIGTENKVKLLFAGRLVEIKGAHTAIEAFSRLQTLAPSTRRFQLTIVGDDRDAAYLARLHHLAESLGCASQITFRPPVAPEDLPQLFEDHDLYLFPSLYEPFSLTLIHALAAGIPTIASRIGGNVEIIEEGETGLLFDRADSKALAKAINRVCNDKELRLRISEQGRIRAGSFTYKKMLECMQGHLSEAAGMTTVAYADQAS